MFKGKCSNKLALRYSQQKKTRYHWDQRETREGWPLLTVGTESNGGTHGVHMKGVLHWLVHCARCAAWYKRFLFCLSCSSQPSTKYIMNPHRTLFHFICPHYPVSWAGSPAASPISEYLSLIGTHSSQPSIAFLEERKLDDVLCLPGKTSHIQLNLFNGVGC